MINITKYSSWISITLGIWLGLHTVNLSAQSCSAPNKLIMNKADIATEVKGESWQAIAPNDSAISLWAMPRNSPLPNEIYLRDSACGTKNYDIQQFYDSDDGIYRFRFFNLTPGITYYLVLSGVTGSGYEMDVVVTSIASIGSTCTTADPCGFIANSGFEEEDPNNPITSVPYSLARYIDYACGWGIGSTHPGGSSPDYYLAGLESGLFGLVTSCTNLGPGNSCGSQTAFGNGVAHLFVRDLRTNVNPLRREMIYTELLTPIATGGMYALDAKVRANVDRVFRSTEVQGRLTSGFVPANNPAAPTLTSYDEVDFGLDLINTNSVWQSASGLFKATSNFDQLIVGNFKSNGSTSVFTGTGVVLQDSIPSVYVDDLNLYFLGDAGKDKAVCLPFSLGTAATCVPPSGVSYAWREPSVSSAVLGTGPVLSVANTSTGIHAYTLTVSYNGESLVDQVTVTTIAPPTFTINNDVACPGNSLSYAIDFGLAKLEPGYTISYPGLNATSAPVFTNGILTFSGTANATGPQAITVTGTQSFNGLKCPFTLTLPFQDCCVNPPAGTITVSNQSYSSLGLNSTLGNTWFLVSGTLTIDHPVVLDHCTLLMLPDARIEVSSNQSLDLVNGTAVLPCTYRWHELFVDKGARLTINDARIESAITGVHMADGASISATESDFRHCLESMFFDNHTSGSVVVEACDFLCGIEGQSPIMKAPLSPNTVGHPFQYESGITFVGSTGVVIDGGTSKNYFHINPGHGLSSSREIAFIYTDNSNDLEFYNNKMAYSYVGFIADHSDNIIIGAKSKGNTINPNLTHSINFTHMKGIESDHSTVICEGNTITNCITAIEINNPNPVLLASQGNVILDNDLSGSTAISIQAPLTQGRVRIIDNRINGLHYGIKTRYAGDCTPNFLNSVFIANNQINLIQTLSAPSNSLPSDTAIGISLLNSECIQVGENSIQSTQPYSTVDPSLSTLRNIGIRVKEGQDNRISRPTISNFEFGILMDDEANSTKFSCLTLNNCNVGIGFKDVGQIVNDVYDFNSGGSPRSVGVSFNSVTNSVYFIGNNSPSNPKKKWYFNSINSAQQPGNISFFFDNQFNALGSICNPLPNFKREDNSHCLINVEFIDKKIWIQHKGDSFVNIINSSGQILFTGEFVDNVEINLPIYTGLIIIHVGNSSCSHVKKFTVFN